MWWGRPHHVRSEDLVEQARVGEDARGGLRVVQTRKCGTSSQRGGVISSWVSRIGVDGTTPRRATGNRR